MDFTLSEQQAAIRDSVARVCADFGDDYWLERDRSGEFPEELYAALAGGGWLGVAMPESVGGSGLGITEAALVAQAVSESGAGFSGASAIHMNIFGLHPVVVHGTDEQRRRMLPPLIRGEHKACFAVTEPDVGLDTTRLKTRARREGDHYVVSGSKVWTSTAQVADRMLILTRTTPLEETRGKADGLTLFYTPVDRGRMEIREIDKMGRHCVDSNQVFLDGVRVPVEDRIGPEGEGFRCILDGLNPERILIAAEAVGLGKAAVRRAARYARERVVFDRPIGSNQGVQHPLAEAWMQLEAAELMTWRAASRYDAGESSGVEANSAKYLAAEAAFRACETALITHGGYGYAREYHVERYLRESMIPRIAPVSPQLILCFIAERALGLPKSY